MKNYKFVIDISLNDNSGNARQYLKLRDMLAHLLSREENNLLEGGFNYVTDILVSAPNISITPSSYTPSMIREQSEYGVKFSVDCKCEPDPKLCQ